MSGLAKNCFVINHEPSNIHRPYKSLLSTDPNDTSGNCAITSRVLVVDLSSVQQVGKRVEYTKQTDHPKITILEDPSEPVVLWTHSLSEMSLGNLLKTN